MRIFYPLFIVFFALSCPTLLAQTPAQAADTITLKEVKVKGKRKSKRLKTRSELNQYRVDVNATSLILALR